MFQDVGMPADYINKLARMFQDIKLSEDLNQDFKDVYRARSAMAGEILLLGAPSTIQVAVQ